MRILAIEPYYGGSHKAFLDGWSDRSRHQWTILGLPAHSWKWRMRHAAVFFSEQPADRASRGERWDFMFCSDMLNLAEFRGGLDRNPTRKRGAEPKVLAYASGYDAEC